MNVSHSLLRRAREAYFSDDRVTTLSFDKVGHSACRSGFEGVGACETEISNLTIMILDLFIASKEARRLCTL